MMEKNEITLQSKQAVEEILDAEGLYKQSECYLMFRPTAEGGITVEDNR